MLQRARSADVVTTNALESEVEAVFNLSIRAASLVDPLFAVDLDGREENHAAHRVAAVQGLFWFYIWDLADDMLHLLVI